MNNVDAYQDVTVAFDALASAALHEFDVALSNEKCAKRNVFLRAGSKFDKDTAFVAMMKQLYPGYPDDDGYTDAKVRINVVGKVVRIRNRGLLMTYLELQSISLCD